MSKEALSTDQLSHLSMLWNQQRCEYQEIQELREKLRAAETRHQKIADEIQQVCGNCPRDATPAPASAGLVRPSTQNAGCGISLPHGHGL